MYLRSVYLRHSRAMSLAHRQYTRLSLTSSNGRVYTVSTVDLAQVYSVLRSRMGTFSPFLLPHTPEAA